VSMRIINALAIALLLGAQTPGAHVRPSVRMVLEGYVVDGRTGLAVERVMVAVRSGVTTVTMTTLRTDAAGQFAIEVDDAAVALSFASRGYATLGVGLSSIPRTPVRIALAAAVSVSGVILHANGSPVRARVQLVPTEPGGLQHVLQAFTRADGSYSIEGASESRSYRLEAETLDCPTQVLRAASGGSLSAGGGRVDVVPRCR